MPTKILYTVLNWGLGHASRSIPIIKQLINNEVKLVIASDGDALLLLQREFPEQNFETLPAYNVKYSEKAKDFDKTIFLQLNNLGKVIQEEHSVCESLIKKHNITHIISDNRYGCYSKNITSTIVCHQLTLQHKSFISKKVMNQVHFKLLNKFDEIWVPDFKQNSLAGEISQTKNKKLQQKIKYIGALSRLKVENLKKQYNLVIILSGPEPQRSILEEKLYKQALNLNTKIAFVRGISESKSLLESNEKISVYKLLETKDLNKILNETKFVVCRAGYSSVMDLVFLNKKAILIPTPGQTEQEYLARILEYKKLFLFRNQDKIDLKKDILSLQEIDSNIEEQEKNTIAKTLKIFLSKNNS